MRAKIYTKENCPFCFKAKDLFSKINMEYDEYVILPNGDASRLKPNQIGVSRDDLLAIAPNAKTVPQIWIDDEHVGGYTELAARYPNVVVTQ